MKRLVLFATLLFFAFLSGSCEYKCEGESCGRAIGDSCEKNDDCGGTTVCDPDTKKCVERECKDSADFCDGGYVCVKGICITCKRKGVDCPKGYDCQNGKCAKVVDCLKDSDCSGGKCESGKCIQTAECIGDLCEDHKLCKAGKCVKCEKSGDCPANLVCYNGGCYDRINSGCLKDANCMLGSICVNKECGSGCRELQDCPTGKKCTSGACVNNPCEGVCNSCGGLYCDSSGKVRCDRNACRPYGSECTIDTECFRGICLLDQQSKKKTCTNCTSNKECTERHSSNHICSSYGSCVVYLENRRKQE